MPSVDVIIRHVWLLLICILFIFICFKDSHCATIPQNAYKYKRLLIKSARQSGFGFNVSPDTIHKLSGQIHAESLWKADAVSWAGATGLSQFMPKTAKWWSEKMGYGYTDMTNPVWSLRAHSDYMYWLYSRESGNTDLDRWFFTFRDYNGGQGWINRDKRLTTKMGKDKNNYKDVELFNAGRSKSAFKENVNYPHKIIFKYAPLYEKDGWGMY